MVAHINWEIMYVYVRLLHFPLIFSGQLCLCLFFSFLIFLNHLLFLKQLFQYKTKREKVEDTTGVDKNGSTFTEELVTTATTAEVLEVRLLLLYFIVIWEVRRKNID